MKKLLFLLFVSGLFAIEISSVEITYGQPFQTGDANNPIESGDIKDTVAHYLLTCEEKKSIKVKFIMFLNESSSLNYFVQYADYFNINYVSDLLGASVDLGIYDDTRITYYNTGFQYQKHFNIKNRLTLKGSLSAGFTNESIRGLWVNDEDLLSWIDSDALSWADDDTETVKGFLGYGLGVGIKITDKLSIILDYESTFTNLEKTYSHVWDHFEKNTDHLYDNIELGLSLNLK